MFGKTHNTEAEIPEIDAEIPPSQAVYRQERSTTEHIFATKILAEKAIISYCYTISLLMHDMSKAFDRVDRAINNTHSR